MEIVELCSWPITCKAPSRSRKLTKVMHEFTEKFGMTFANFLELGPHSQPKWKLINISGEWGHHYLYLHKKGLHRCSRPTRRSLDPSQSPLQSSTPPIGSHQKGDST